MAGCESSVGKRDGLGMELRGIQGAERVWKA